MGSWNTRRVRLTKQLNFFKRMGMSNQDIQSSIVRYRLAFRNNSKAIAFWRSNYSFRNGKFYPTHTAATSNWQKVLGGIEKGAGFAGLARQGINQTRGEKIPIPKKDIQTNRSPVFSAYSSSTKAEVSKALRSSRPIRNVAVPHNKAIRNNSSYEAYRAAHQRKRKQSMAAYKGWETRRKNAAAKAAAEATKTSTKSKAKPKSTPSKAKTASKAKTTSKKTTTTRKKKS